MCKNLKKEKDIYSLKHLSAYEGFKFPLLFHTLTQTVDESFFFSNSVNVERTLMMLLYEAKKERDEEKEKGRSAHL